MIIASLKRRNEALQNECDTLAGAVDNLSHQLTEAYQLLKPYEPAYVAEKMGMPAPGPAIEASGAVEAASAD
jgi:hypothetical protein